MKPFLATILVAVAVASGSCAGDDPVGPGGVVLTPERIGGVWTLLTLQSPGQPEVVPPAGAIFSMEIANGRAAVRADCNRCNGSATIAATTLTVGPALACTRAFCSSAPFDDVFLRILSGESRAFLEGNYLSLHADRGILRFGR